MQEGLEFRIQERTAELELANAFLRREMEERRQAEQEHHKLEAKVQHAQRLESLGVLAGGIAHDFNNLLASIMGYASQQPWISQPIRAPARASTTFLVAAKSAADLTQQMLKPSRDIRHVRAGAGRRHAVDRVHGAVARVHHL